MGMSFGSNRGFTQCKSVLQGHMDTGAHVARPPKDAPAGGWDSDRSHRPRATDGWLRSEHWDSSLRSVLQMEESWTRTFAPGSFPHL